MARTRVHTASEEGLMQGSPPAGDALVTLENWQAQPKEEADRPGQLRQGREVIDDLLQNLSDEAIRLDSPAPDAERRDILAKAGAAREAHERVDSAEQHDNEKNRRCRF